MERCLEAWQLVLPEGTTGLRYQLPADIAADKVLVRLQDATGSWREVPFTADGSYLVFSAQDSDTGMQLILRPYNYTTLILLLIGILAVAGTLCTVLLIRRKKKK